MYGDDDIMDDEEIGLRKQAQRKKPRRKIMDTLLDERISGSFKFEKEKSVADKSVLRASIINVLLIASWYCFSLSISIVRVSEN